MAEHARSPSQDRGVQTDLSPQTLPELLEALNLQTFAEVFQREGFESPSDLLGLDDDDAKSFAREIGCVHLCFCLSALAHALVCA